MKGKKKMKNDIISGDGKEEVQSFHDNRHISVGELPAISVEVSETLHDKRVEHKYSVKAEDIHEALTTLKEVMKLTKK